MTDRFKELGFTVRDGRKQTWVEVDHEIIDQYMPFIGAACIGAYCLICRLAAEGSVGVSQKELARMLKDIDADYALENLEENGLISIARHDTTPWIVEVLK